MSIPKWHNTCQNEHPGNIVILTHPVVSNLCNRFELMRVGQSPPSDETDTLQSVSPHIGGRFRCQSVADSYAAAIRIARSSLK